MKTSFPKAKQVLSDVKVLVFHDAIETAWTIFLSLCSTIIWYFHCVFNILALYDSRNH